MKVFIGVPHQSPAFSIELIKESLFDYVTNYNERATWYVYETREEFAEDFPEEKTPAFFPCLAFWDSVNPTNFFEVCDPEDEEAKEEIAFDFLKYDLNSGLLLSSLAEVEEEIKYYEKDWHHQGAEVLSLLDKAKESFKFWED